MTERPAKYDSKEVYWTFYDEIKALPRIDRETISDLNVKNIRALRDYEESRYQITILESKIRTARRAMKDAVFVRDGCVDVATRLGYDVELLKHNVHTSDAYRDYMAEEAEVETDEQ